MTSGNVTTVGGLFTRDLLELVARESKELPGLDGESYNVRPGNRIRDEINQAYTHLQAKWSNYRAKASAWKPEHLKTGPEGGDPVFDHWIKPLFAALGYRFLPQAPPRTIDGHVRKATYWYHHTPIHAVSADWDLDDSPGHRQLSPHGLVQLLVNREDDARWGIATNGLRLRLLRDNASLTKQAYVEFDVEAIFTGGDEAGFTSLFLFVHASRFEADRLEDQWIERWFQEGQKIGVRALDRIQSGIKDAILQLGRGFLKYPSSANDELRKALADGTLTAQQYYQYLLRLVYRLVFLFVTEDRGILLAPDASPSAKRYFAEFYGTQRLRQMAHSRGTKHYDLWMTLKVVMDGLKAEPGLPQLALPPLNGPMWRPDFLGHLNDARISNEDLLLAIRHLSLFKDEKTKVLHQVNYKDLGAQELGGVYESLLEQHAKVDVERRAFLLHDEAAGHERKTTGSYYTPPELVDLTLEKALDPVLDRAVEGKAAPEAAKAILALKVVDPTCGSGHFLVAAAHRMAKRLSQARSGVEEPSVKQYQESVRDIIAHCMYGVDLNPMAVELCKVSLWLEAMAPGTPLVFLEQRVQLGNGFLGCTPKMLLAGIPAEAFKPLKLDNADVCKAAKELNKKELKGIGSQSRLMAFDETRQTIAKQLEAMDAMGDANVAQVAAKERTYEEILGTKEYHAQRLALDAYCAAWMQVKDGSKPVITTGRAMQLLEDPDGAPTDLVQAVEDERAKHHFLHWHLAFPEVFQAPRGDPNPHTGWAGGFDVVIGNPPWERTKIQEEEWFASRRPDISQASKASVRKTMIANLASTDPALLAEFEHDQRGADAISGFVRLAGNFPLTGMGDINTYAIFTENNRNLISTRGRVGCIVPTGIVTEFNKRFFFRDVARTRSLVSVTGFENEAFIFPAVHHAMRFCILVLCARNQGPGETRYSFYARSVAQARDEVREYSLSWTQVQSLSANTQTSPVYRSQRDAVIMVRMFEKAEPLVLEDENEHPIRNPWRVSLQRMFDMANDSSLFSTEAQLPQPGKFSGNVWLAGEGRFLPLVEGKMFWQFDHRYGTYQGITQAQWNVGSLPKLNEEQHANPEELSKPEFWLPEHEVRDHEGSAGWPRLAFRDVVRATDRRTAIFSLAPRAAYNNKAPLVCLSDRRATLLFLAMANSMCFDYAIRNGLSGAGLGFFIMKQAPVLTPEELERPAPWNAAGTVADWILPRVAELALTSWDTVMPPEAPFKWNDVRRAAIRAELDAAFFILFGLDDSQAEHVMDSFVVQRQSEEKAFGEYRTKRAVLDELVKMRAADHNSPFVSQLQPPPGAPAVRHSPRILA